jgi:hypothetical protein
MDKKSFLIGVVTTTVVFIAIIMFADIYRDDPATNGSEVVENEYLDTEYDVKAYEHGYYTCLQDTRPDLHMAFMSCIVQLQDVQGDEAFNAIVDAECAKRGLGAQDKEYLCTLLLD